MSVKIRRYNLAELSPVLATRPAGREAGAAAAALLAGGDMTLLNFHGVEVASPSFLSELINGVRGQLLAGEQHWLLVTGMNEDVAEAMELVLDRAKMVLGQVQDRQIELIGGSDQLRETLAEAVKLRSFTAPELADRLKLKLPALHQRLNQLIEAGLLTREDDPTATRGKRGKFHAPPDSPDQPGDADDLAAVSVSA